MKYPHFIEFWLKPSYNNIIDKNEQTNGIISITEEALLKIGKPIKLLKVKGSLTSYNLLATISPDASYFAVFNNFGLKVFLIDINQIKEFNEISSNNSEIILKIWDSTENWNDSNQIDEFVDSDDNENFVNNNLFVTALLLTNKYLYFAEGNFKIWQLNLKNKEKKLIAYRGELNLLFFFCLINNFLLR